MDPVHPATIAVPARGRIVFAGSTCNYPKAYAMAHCPSSRSQSCVKCRVRELCLLVGLDSTDAQRLADIIPQRIKIRKGTALFHPGDPLRFLYAVRHGFFKTSLLSADGREQLTGFQMSGELLGIDAISSGQHVGDAIALEDSEVCPIHFSQLERLSRELPSLHHNLNRTMSREVVRDHEMLLWMGNLNAEERLGAFLLDLSARMQRRGYSPHAFVLRMTREDIGAYLGLRLETVCRAIAYLRSNAIVRISGRAVEIISPERLEAMVFGVSVSRKPRVAGPRNG
jgi:CRP/FNR family transcriptional regulator